MFGKEELVNLDMGNEDRIGGLLISTQIVVLVA